MSVGLDLTFLSLCFLPAFGGITRDNSCEASRTDLGMSSAQECWLLLDACLELKGEFQAKV